MNHPELLEALEAGIPLIWNDPDPIEGNDYRITYIGRITKESALIHYGEGSEAEVPISEIDYGEEGATEQIPVLIYRQDLKVSGDLEDKYTLRIGNRLYNLSDPDGMEGTCIYFELPEKGDESIEYILGGEVLLHEQPEDIQKTIIGRIKEIDKCEQQRS